MTANEIIINIEHFGWCTWDDQDEGEGAHYIYSALSRCSSLCDESKYRLPSSADMTNVPPGYPRCERCLEKIRKEKERVSMEGK